MAGLGNYVFNKIPFSAGTFNNPWAAARDYRSELGWGPAALPEAATVVEAPAVAAEATVAGNGAAAAVNLARQMQFEAK